MDDRLTALPKRYELALRLDAAGADAALIADCLEVEPAAVAALLELAAAKLRSLPDGSVDGPSPATR